MAHQKPTLNYGTADESSPLFLAVVDGSPSSFSFSLGQAGVTTQMKKGVLLLAVVATCFLLGVIYQGSSSNNRAVDLSEAALLRSAAPVYDPKKDNCFQEDQEGWSVEMLEAADWSDSYCWSSSDSVKGWKLVGGPGYKKVGPPIVINGICGTGKKCTES